MRPFILFIISLTLAACSQPPAPPDDAGSDADLAEGDGDLSTGDGDVQPGDADAPAGDADFNEYLPIDCETYLQDDYGIREGQVMPPATLWSCDQSIVTIPQICCDSDATIIHLSLAWCGACETSTSLVLSEVMEPLEGESVTLVELVLEGEHGVVADAAACTEWTGRFDGRVTSVIPPRGVISQPIDEIASVGSPPVTYLVDRRGVIRWRSNVILPDHFEEEAQRLLSHTREVLEEEGE